MSINKTHTIEQFNQPITFADKQRFVSLDGLRGLAIISILILHYIVLPIVRSEESLLSSTVSWIGMHLWSGVDFFFVLSGYLIASILLRERHHSAYLVQFFIRRAFRIFPLYWVLLLSYIILSIFWKPLFTESTLLEHSYPFYAYAGLFQNFFLAQTGSYGGDFLAATWSLAIEVQFYCLVPFLVRWFNWKQLLITCGLLIVFSLYARVLHEYPASYSYPFCRGDGLFMGVAIAILIHQPACIDFLERIKRHGSYIFAASIVCYILTAILMPHAGGIFNHFLFSIAYAGVLLVVLLDKAVFPNFFRTPLLVWLGQKSYGVYLFHYGILIITFHLLLHKPPRLDYISDWGVVGLSLMITLVMVQLISKWIEMPMIAMGKRLASNYSTNR